MLRLGFLTLYLTEPFVSGFTSGAAFHAFTSQIPLVFGLTSTSRIRGPFKLPKFYGQLIPSLYSDMNWMSTAIALISIVALYVAKDLNDRYKSSIGFVLPNELVLVSVRIYSRSLIYSFFVLPLARHWHSCLSLHSAPINLQCVRRRSNQTRSSLAKCTLAGQSRSINHSDVLFGHR